MPINNSSEPDTLETLLGADGNTQKAFITILLSSLRRLESGVDALTRKLDAFEDGHARDVSGIGGRIAGIEGRVEHLEKTVQRKDEGNWRYVQAGLLLLAGLGTIVALLRH